MPDRVIRRSGERVPFDGERIRLAIAAAGRASGEFADRQAAQLAQGVVVRLPATGAVELEAVQDLAEQALMEAGHYASAKAFILHRARHGRLRRDRKALVDVAASMNEYLSREDWRVRANANQGYSLGGLILNVSGKVTANYWLDEVYSPAIGAAHREGDLHIHDLDMLAGYCAGWSLRTLLNEGFNGVPGRVEAGPPKHLSSALGQMVNFLGTLQNEWAGAQAFSSFDTYLAPFVRKDGLGYEQVRQAIQEFIHNLNVPSRWGTQTPFTNLTFDWVCPEDLREQIPYIGGEEMPFAYGELQAEMALINRAYIEVMMAGDGLGRVFTFPIPTYNITHDFPWDSDNATRLFDMTARYGLPYFQNFLNSDMQPNQVRSMCCRLQLDVRELLKRGGGLFGHLNWHLGLFELHAGNVEGGLRLYTEAFCADDHRGAIHQKLSDSAAFLWRSELAGHPRDPARWERLKEYAREKLQRPGMSLADWHVALTYAATGDVDALDGWIEAIEELANAGRYPSGSVIPTVARAFAAYERGDYATTIGLIEPMLPERERIGGSRAQGDLVEATLLQAYLASGRDTEAERLAAARRTGPARLPVTGSERTVA